MSGRVSLRGMLIQIRVDTLHRIHNVGFLVERLISNKDVIIIQASNLIIGIVYIDDQITPYRSKEVHNFCKHFRPRKACTYRCLLMFYL